MSGTAELHDATLTPTKLELLAGWIGSQPWFEGDPAELQKVGSFRFVDPDGEVGIETLLVRSKGVTYQVPLTYRAAPLDEAANALVGTMEHSVLGTRYAYDAIADPVYTIEIFRVIHEGDTEAELSRGEKTASVQGSGITLVSNAAGETVRIVRVLDGNHLPRIQPLGTLVGTWNEEDGERTEVLAVLR